MLTGRFDFGDMPLPNFAAPSRPRRGVAARPWPNAAETVRPVDGDCIAIAQEPLDLWISADQNTLLTTINDTFESCESLAS